VQYYSVLTKDHFALGVSGFLIIALTSTTKPFSTFSIYTKQKT